VLHTLPTVFYPQHADIQPITRSISTVPHQQQAEEKMTANDVPPPHAAPTNAGASQQNNETLEANEEAMLLRRLDILAIYTKANDREAFSRVVDDIIKRFGQELFSRLWLHMLRDEARREVARILATAPGLPEPSQVCKSCPNIILKAQY
jgi:hypothetical protein